MFILISSFYLSLIGIIAMILIKRAEIKKPKQLLPSSFGKSLETHLSKIFSTIQNFLRLINRRTFIALIQYITYHLLYIVRKVYVEIKHRTLLNPHGRKMIDAVRGRGEIKNHGASFYLRRISDR